MTTIYRALSELETTHQPAVLCTVVKTSGSTPRHSTSKMLVYPDGHILGTVGGGELENRVIQEALDSLKDGNPRLLEYSLADPARGDVGICGGQVEVFVEPILQAPSVVVIGGGHVGKAVAHLKKVLSSPNLTAAIPGMSTVQQLEENVQASYTRDVALTEQELRELAAQEEGFFDRLPVRYHWLRNWEYV